jgi:hypothetical protein
MASAQIRFVDLNHVTLSAEYWFKSTNRGGVRVSSGSRVNVEPVRLVLVQLLTT